MSEEFEAEYRDRSKIPDGKLRISVVAQLTPIGRYLNPEGPQALAGQTIQEYADDLTKYLGEQLERFADPRGGDVFLHVVVDDRNGRGGGEYRSGHFVKEEGGDDAAVEVDVHGQAPAEAAGTEEGTDLGDVHRGSSA